MYFSRSTYAAVLALSFSAWTCTAFVAVHPSSLLLSSFSSRSIVSRAQTTQIYAEQKPLPNVDTMKSAEMKQELESYGISTQSMTRESDISNALKKAREEGLKSKLEETKEPSEEEIKKEEATQVAKGDNAKQNEDKPTTTATQGDDASASRLERYQMAFEEAKQMKVKALKEELISRGISTTTMLEKTEFVKAYADAIADNVPKNAPPSSSSSSSSSSTKKATTRKPEEPMDPSYRDVVTQKFDRQRLVGQSVIDVGAK
jgi:hypothetical protein